MLPTQNPATAGKGKTLLSTMVKTLFYGGREVMFLCDTTGQATFRGVYPGMELYRSTVRPCIQG